VFHIKHFAKTLFVQNSIMLSSFTRLNQNCKARMNFLDTKKLSRLKFVPLPSDSINVGRSKYDAVECRSLGSQWPRKESRLNGTESHHLNAFSLQRLRYESLPFCHARRGSANELRALSLLPLPNKTLRPRIPSNKVSSREQVELFNTGQKSLQKRLPFLTWSCYFTAAVYATGTG